MNVVPGKEAINRYITFLTVSCWSRCQSVTLLYLCTPLSATLCSITLYKLNNYHTQRHLVFPATTLPSFRSGRGKIERSARRLMKLLTISPSDSSIGGMGLVVRSPRKSLKRHLMRRHRHPYGHPLLGVCCAQLAVSHTATALATIMKQLVSYLERWPSHSSEKWPKESSRMAHEMGIVIRKNVLRSV